MSEALAILSQSVSRVVADAAAWLCAIRTGPNRHVTGLVCEGNLIITCDQALPPLELYSIALPNGMLVGARAGGRDAGANLAVLALETAWAVPNPKIAETLVGGLAIVVGAAPDASPTVRLTVVHRLLRTADGPAAVLDLSSDRIDAGALVFDADGRLIGLASEGTNGEALAIPSAAIERMLTSGKADAAIRPAIAFTSPPAHRAVALGRRAWLGVALQPITVPDALAARAGQSSGRMVVSVTKGGPAETAGLRVGDVLLALNGTSASGPHALRAFLTPEKIGSTIEIKLLRDGNTLTAHLAVAGQPG